MADSNYAPEDVTKAGLAGGAKSAAAGAAMGVVVKIAWACARR